MIQPISDASLLGAAANSSYDAARTSAEEKSFQATLDELRRKAEAAHSSAAADPAVGYVPKNPMSDADVQAKKLREACEGCVPQYDVQADARDGARERAVRKEIQCDQDL